MYDTVWAGIVQMMTFSLGVPKGMKKILEECGINTDTLNAVKCTRFSPIMTTLRMKSLES